MNFDDIARLKEATELVEAGYKHTLLAREELKKNEVDLESPDAYADTFTLIASQNGMNFDQLHEIADEFRQMLSPEGLKGYVANICNQYGKSLGNLNETRFYDEKIFLLAEKAKRIVKVQSIKKEMKMRVEIKDEEQRAYFNVWVSLLVDVHIDPKLKKELLFSIKQNKGKKLDDLTKIWIQRLNKTVKEFEYGYDYFMELKKEIEEG